MKERSKEKIAELMMDELISHLSESGRLRKLLGGMTGLPIGQLVEDLIREFEEVLERYHEKNLASLAKPVKSSQSVLKDQYTPDFRPSIPLPVVPDLPDSEPVVQLKAPLPAPPSTILEEVSPPIPLIETPAPKVEPVVSSVTTEPSPPIPPVERTPIVTPDPVPLASAPKDNAEQKVKGVPKDNGLPKDKADPKDNGREVVDFRSKLEELARRVETEYLQKLEQKAPKKRETIEGSTNTQEKKEKEKPRQTIEVGLGEGGRPSRIPFRIDDQEYMYVHGVMFIPPNERACEHPFMLEEKGIDGKEFAFAQDFEDVRFFLSKVDQKEMNVSRKGVLLLGKAESIQLHGLHESILNELRAHGIVLPMDFGTVAKGKSDLQGLAGKFHDDIRTSLKRLAKTSWWTLSMSVMDGRIAQLFADEQPGKSERDGRQRDRVSYSAGSVQVKKFDVKLLEKILQKEKRLAESVHQELSTHAERCEVQTMVGLGSGSSDDWKVILRATYLVSGTIGYQRFTRAVTDLQYRHILFEPLLSIAGDAESFSFLRK